MANKKSPLDPATRIRNNQRRARQRQKERLAELQDRVSEYEHQGVQASVQLQTSARNVVRENTALRALLAAKGVDESEVRAWVLEFGDAALEEEKCVPVKSDRKSYGGGKRADTMSSTKTCSQNGQSTKSAPVSKRSYCSIESRPDRITFKLQDQSNQEAQCAQPIRGARGSEGDGIPDSATSCFEAAEMLVAIRREDRDQALLSLGCKSGTDCRIRNTELLEIMDS